MTVRQKLDEVLGQMSEERLTQVLDFAEFLTERDEYEAFHEFGRRQLARLYEDDEVEYTEADIIEELDE